MNKQFHQLAPLLALKQMPDKFQAFFIAGGYTEDQLKIDADLPDTTDHDNITINSEIHHAHSYKLQEIADAKGNKYLDYVDGDCLQRLKGLAADVHDFHAEGKPDMVRYALAKMTHYRVDALTYPHLHRGKPWSEYHDLFETQMGHFIVAHAEEIGPLKFETYEDVYKGTRQTALTAWYEGGELVKLYEIGGRISVEQAIEVCRKAVKGIGDTWLTLAGEMGLTT
ncbi:MAG: hypothetical protein ACYCVD_04290 [Desulfitobacteriaceae bacterium]